MTRPRMGRTADFLHELAVAATIGSVGDLVIVGTRRAMDIVGLGLGAIMFALSLKLTIRGGGPRL